MENILGILFSVAIGVCGIWMIGNQIIQARAEKQIEKFNGPYIAAAAKLGITFKLFSYSGDPTPGSDTVVAFEGPTVKAELTPVQALYFLKTAHKGTPDILYLEKKSKWPSSPILR
jgi:hypothetical protein